MGAVYHNAALVVAASGARDSREGLFITDRPPAIVFRLPYRLDGVCRGTFNMTFTPENSDPSDGSLEERAWALQERYLARRLMTFIPGGVSWICQTLSVNEAGGDDVFFFESHSWFQLLRRYTMKSLTIPSDRVQAIRGIAAEQQCFRKDGYIPVYGVWEDRLVHQLLWMRSGPPYHDGCLDLPSWSWIATGCHKIWPFELHESYDGMFRAQEMPQRFIITLMGGLHIVGHLSTTQPTPRCVPDTLLPRLWKTQLILWLHDNLGSDRCHHLLIRDIDVGKEVLRVALFDNDETISYSHCFLAAQSNKLGGRSDALIDPDVRSMVRSSL
jgi:hypothetical protein